MTKSDSSETPNTARLLDGIRSPADIKALNEPDLPQLAQEVRDELIKVLSQTGGHLGPNLGVVELTIALHRVFETPTDEPRLAGFTKHGSPMSRITRRETFSRSLSHSDLRIQV